MFTRSEWAEWRQFPITKALLKDIEETATATANKILTSETFDGYNVQYQKGILIGLSTVVGWQPAFDPDDGIVDVLDQEDK